MPKEKSLSLFLADLLRGITAGNRMTVLKRSFLMYRKELLYTNKALCSMHRKAIGIEKKMVAWLRQRSSEVNMRNSGQCSRDI